MRKIDQTKIFERGLKKINANEKKIIDREIRKILEAPEKGDRKKGDLAGVYTVAFKMHGAQFRLMYEFDAETITLLRFGSRENFYR